MEIHEACLATEISDFDEVAPVFLVIDKRAEMDAIVLTQVLEQVIGANFIPFVRRIGNSMNEIKKFLHDLTQISYHVRADEIGKRQG